MSEFTDVDTSRDPQALVAALDAYYEGLGAMKAYMTAAAVRAVPGGQLLDIGCGAGHDLERMVASGLRCVGVDPSAVMVATSRDRLADGRAEQDAEGGAAVLRGDGLALPFRDSSFDGCRMERVLQHVLDPAAVLAGAGRVVRPDGFLAVFEPDWTSVTFEPSLPEVATHHLVSSVRHPEVGGRLAELVEAAGFAVDDEVIERSRTERLVGVPWSVERRLRRAVHDGALSGDVARRAWRALREHDDAGRFRASWTKVLVVASRR
jgi:SAM-dependent methyltransferase